MRAASGPLRAIAMGVRSLANETGDSHALRASERATRFNSTNLIRHGFCRVHCRTLKAIAMGVRSLANETGDSHALRASERATRFNIL